METFNSLLNQFGGDFFIFVAIAFLTFILIVMMVSRQRKKVFQKIDESLKMQKDSLKLQNICNQQYNTMIHELRRANRILSTIAEMDAYEESPIEEYRESNIDPLQSAPVKLASGTGTSSLSQSTEGEGFKLYVGNIDYAASENELASYFSQVGLVEFVNIPVNRYTGKARGFGFVTFSSKDDAERAMTLHGTEFKGRQIQVNFAKERDYV